MTDVLTDVPTDVPADVIVLGAGPAGLMAAYQAARAGYRCTVLEAASHVGGMAGSFEIDGHRVDYGSHRLHPATPPELLDLLRSLLGEDLQVRPRSGRIRLGGRWVGFPLRATDLIRNLPPRLARDLTTDSLRLLTRRAAGPGRSRPVEPTFHDQVVHQLGPTVAEQFYAPFARKLYGLDAGELSEELARRRVSASSPLDIARRLIRAGRPTGRTFLYPRRGYGQISEGLAEAAVAAGATIELNAEVRRVRVDPDRVAVTAGGVDHGAPIALSTIPITGLAAMLDPAPPPEVTAALAGLRTRSMILVYLVLDSPQYTRFDAHYLPGPDTAVARLSEPKNYRDGDDPTGSTVLCAEIPCWPTDEIWTWSDDRLAELVAQDLLLVGLPAVQPIGIDSRRLRSVYPVYDLAGADNRATVERWSPGPRLPTLGRQGLRVIDNLHHVLAMGRDAVDAIDGFDGIDPDRWRAHLARYASHTVED